MSEILVEKLDSATKQKELVVKAGEDLTLIIFNKGFRDISYNLKASIAKDAKLNIYNVVTSKYKTQLTEEVTMNGENGNCNILNVLLSYEDGTIDSNIMIHHDVELTTSEFNNYAIALDNASMILNNNATIKKGAKGTVVHQRAKGLTLSENAKIKAMPNLFIDEYDVIAAHAASIGSISKDDLFYLMSRGLTLEEASKLIVLGFVQPLLDKIDNKELRKEIKQNFEEKLS